MRCLNGEKSKERRVVSLEGFPPSDTSEIELRMRVGWGSGECGGREWGNDSGRHTGRH